MRKTKVKFDLEEVQQIYVALDNMMNNAASVTASDDPKWVGADAIRNFLKDILQ